MQDHKTINIGILGFGKMGQLRARHFDALQHCKIIKVYDVSWPDEVAYSIAVSPDEIINDPNIDAVVICTPNYLIKKHTVAALAKGKHVFCEKPPAMNAQEVGEIIAARDMSGTTLMYGFNHRQHAAVMKMKDLVDGGSMGKVLWMRGRYGKSVDAEYLTGWRANKDLAGGGILLDQGIHMLDLFLHIGGREFDEVQAMVSSLYWKTEGIEDNVFAIMRNRKTGMCAQLHSTMTQWRHLFSLEVFLEKGYMVLNGLKTGSGSYGDEVLTVARNRSKAPAASWQEEERFDYPTDVSWQSEALEFVSAIHEPNTQKHGTAEAALQVMRLVDAIYRNDTHVSEKLHEDLQSGR
jgi:1,5-anhydro-D-fructose reductase (1,5-anhydro-D-mannitol-forming)